jgi:hypothetical protein
MENPTTASIITNNKLRTMPITKALFTVVRTAI